MSLTYQDVARIFALLDAAKGEDVNLTMGDLHLSATSWQDVAEVPAVAPPASTKTSPRIADNTEAATVCALTQVPSPAVGFYTKGKAALGQQVREGDAIAEIAHGDTVTRVTAPTAGRLLDIAPVDGDFIGYGEILAVIDRA